MFPRMNALSHPPAKHRRLRLTVADFELLNENGAFDDYGKTELLDGHIFIMNSQYRRHSRVQSELLIELGLRLREVASPWTAMVEASIRLSAHSMPEPDIVLTNDPDGAGFMPLESVGMIIEVADSTQRTDLGKKSRLYAKAGVPEYWVLDTQTCMAHQHWAPKASAWTQRREIAFGQPITAETIPGLTVTLPA